MSRLLSPTSAEEMSASSPILQDEMQKRRMMKKATTRPCFQTRIFVLYKDVLVYKIKERANVRGSISILSIKICEDVLEEAFNRYHVFQIGYLEKGKMFYLYIQAGDDTMREHWKQHIRRLCSTYNDHRMQERYHTGHYKKSWTCCQNSDKHNIGCTTAYNYNTRPANPAVCKSPVPCHSKTPITMRHMHTTRVKMPSECYDSEHDDDERMSSPNSEGSDILQNKASDKPSLSSQSLRYTSKPAFVMDNDGSRSSRSLEFGLSTSTPNYNCPITYSRGESCEGTTAKRYYSLSSTTSEAIDLDRFDSRAGTATFSERFDSLLGRVGNTRLDSQGSTVDSSSSTIPRTESDYQARVDESDFTMTYTRAKITASSSVESELENMSHVTRLESGTYVNINKSTR